MATTALAGKWMDTCLEMRATAIKSASEIFQREINENRIPEDEQAKAHLITGNSIFRGQAKTRARHPAIRSIVERESEEEARPTYVYGRHDDPIGHRFDDEGKKWGFQMHPSPPSYHEQKLMCDVPWLGEQRIRGHPPRYDNQSEARVRMHGGTDKSVGPPMPDGSDASSGPESQQWQHIYAEWWGNNPTVLFDCYNRVTHMEPLVKQAYMTLAGFDENFWSAAYQDKCAEFRTRAMEAV